jgi:hypothetical protein
MSPILGARGGLAASAYGFTSGAAAVGDYESIATVTIGAGGASSAVFNSIPSTYSHLQIRINYAPVVTGILKMNFNGDTGANYKGHFVAGDGATAYAAVPSTSPNSICVAYNGGTSFGASVVDVLDYANVNKYKVSRSLSGTDRNGSGDIEFDSGLWINTAAITSITFSGQNGNLKEYSSFALYGVK